MSKGVNGLNNLARDAHCRQGGQAIGAPKLWKGGNVVKFFANRLHLANRFIILHKVWIVYHEPQDGSQDFGAEGHEGFRRANGFL